MRQQPEEPDDASTLDVRPGLGSVATITTIDSSWDGGILQLVSTILEPPAKCSTTMRGVPSLSALDVALNRTGLWPALNTMPNVTCLAPITRAFVEAGNPQDSDEQGAEEELTRALMAHTLSMPVYQGRQSGLVDGMRVANLNGDSVLVTSNSSGTWFNDAKVVTGNVL